MPVQIDLTKAYLSRQYGDLIAVLSWMNDQRALFLIPTFRRGAPWFVVLERAAFEWDDRYSKNIANVAQRAFKACEVLGLSETPIQARRIVAIVNDSIPDLIAMPSAPPVEYHRASYGHLTVREDGKPIVQQDIRVEQDGVTYG